MPSQEDFTTIRSIAELVIKFGFLGVGLVLTLVVAPLTYKIWQARGITLGVACFGIAFLVTFGALDVVSRYAPAWIASNRTIIVGVVRGVQDGYQVQMQSNLSDARRAYIKREFDRDHRDILNFPFIFLSKAIPTCFAIAISSTDPHAEGDTSVFHFAPLSSEDTVINREIIAEVIRHENTLALKVWRERDAHRIGESQTLEPLAPTDEGCVPQPPRAPQSWLLVTRESDRLALG